MFKKIEEFSRLENIERIKLLTIVMVIASMSLVFTSMLDRSNSLDELHNRYTTEISKIQQGLNDIKVQNSFLQKMVKDILNEQKVSFNDNDINKIVSDIGESLKYELGFKNRDLNISDIKSKLMKEDEIRAKMKKLEKQYTIEDIYDYINMFEEELKHFLNSEKNLQNRN